MARVWIATASPEDGIAGWAVNLMESLGEFGAGLAIALENLFPPLPSEVILPLAGFTASRGEFTLIGALLATTAGSVAGAAILYAVGAGFGRGRTRTVVARLPLVDLDDLYRAEQWFALHGDKAVFFGRMVPLVRSLISLPAGIERMPFGRFVLLTAAGSALWNTVFVLAGYWLGENWALVEPYGDALQLVVIVLAAIAIAYFIVKRWNRARSGAGP